MTRAELEAAYMRSVQQRNYAWRRVRALQAATREAGANPAAARQTTERADSSERAVQNRRTRLSTNLNNMMRLRPPSDHPHALNALMQKLS
eukprot:4342819-Pleurochrysis_carterae.AAC.1